MIRKVLAAIIFSILISFPSYAIDVTTSNSEGTGSLSDAINQANRGTDTVINIRHPRVGTITLTRELTIERNVTINGNGVTIEGTNERRLFRITSGHAVFNAITFTKGYASSGNGGAVEVANNDAWAEFNNCTFFGNRAQGYGGAVGVTTGSINSSTVLKHCTISGNEAYTDGGGVAVLNGDMRIYSSIVVGNSSDIYAASSRNFRSLYNVTGTSNCDMDSTDLTGQSVSDVLMTDDAGQLRLDMVNGVQVLKLSGTSVARDIIPRSSAYTLSDDEAGTSRPQITAYDAGAYEALPVPVQSIDVYGVPYIQINDRGALSIDIYPEDASLNVRDYPPDGVEWTSSNESVLTVDSSGNTRAIGLGESGVGNSSVTARVHGWDASGNPSVRTARAFTVYVGEDPISAVRATITPIPDETLTLGGYKLITPEVQLDVNDIVLPNIKAGINYKLRASSSNRDIVNTEIVSEDSIRLLAGNIAGSADVTVIARPVPEEDTQAMYGHFTVTVSNNRVNDAGSSGGGCEAGAFGLAGMLLAMVIIYRKE